MSTTALAVVLAVPFALPFIYLIVRNAGDLSGLWAALTDGDTIAPAFRSLLLGTSVAITAGIIGTGAAWMVADGAMEGVEALFGVHVFPSIAVGSVGVRCGSLTAAAGELEIEVLGESGHGARPHQSTDAIWIAARVVSGLQEAISRRLDPLHPVVVSFGRIEGGKAFNVIADHVRLLGTVRCLDADVHDRLPGWIEDTVHALCRGHGGEARVHYRRISPPVHNDPDLTRLVAATAVDLLGDSRVEWLEQPSLGAEDFAALLEGHRGTMFRLGVAGPAGCTPLHSNTFAPDEDCLAVGIRVLTLSLLRWMATPC
jgi:amidohydrolase